MDISNLILKIVELYPTWEKVNLTKEGYVLQRQAGIIQMIDYIQESIKDDNESTLTSDIQ
jgi:hypothetical protein